MHCGENKARLGPGGGLGGRAERGPRSRSRGSRLPRTRVTAGGCPSATVKCLQVLPYLPQSHCLLALNEPGREPRKSSVWHRGKAIPHGHGPGPARPQPRRPPSIPRVAAHLVLASHSSSGFLSHLSLSPPHLPLLSHQTDPSPICVSRDPPYPRGWAPNRSGNSSFPDRPRPLPTGWGDRVIDQDVG